jgi:hypothetical protein
MAQQDSAKSEIFNKTLVNIREHVDLRKKDEARETEDFVAVCTTFLDGCGRSLSNFFLSFNYLLYCRLLAVTFPSGASSFDIFSSKALTIHTTTWFFMYDRIGQRNQATTSRRKSLSSY